MLKCSWQQEQVELLSTMMNGQSCYGKLYLTYLFTISSFFYNSICYYPYQVMIDDLYIEESRHPTHLIILDMLEFDIVLGMDWLIQYNAYK